MRYSMTSLVLATLALGQAAQAAVGGVHSHFHNHARKHAEYMRSAAKRDASLTAADASKLQSFSFSGLGINSAAPTSNAWLGSDGPYTNTFTNNAGEDLILVVWGPAGSWVNAVPPLIAISLSAGQSQTISFADGASGAWSAIYADTEMSNGQISNTWGEYTMGTYGVVDVSREVNMSGHGMSVVGPECTTDMDTCVFTCSSGNTCMTGYLLLNCENGSQPGATYGTFDGAPSGGCGGMGSSAALKTSLF